jgi:multiple antibiotic resistance protein
MGPIAFDANEFLKYVAAMIAIVDPVGAVPVVLALTPDYDRRARVMLAVVATITVFATLSVSALLGARILGLFAISVDTFRVAGGLVIAISAIRLVSPSAVAEAEASLKPRHNPAIVPIGIPLLAGPASIATAIAFANYPHPQWRIFANHALGLAVVSLTTFLCLSSAVLVQRLLGAAGMRVVSQVMGLILLSVGIEMILHGLAVHLGWPVSPL